MDQHCPMLFNEVTIIQTHKLHKTSRKGENYKPVFIMNIHDKILNTICK